MYVCIFMYLCVCIYFLTHQINLYLKTHEKHRDLVEDTKYLGCSIKPRKTQTLTWHFINISKKSSSSSLLLLAIKCPRTDWLLCWLRRRPGRLLKLARWSSRRRLWELASKSRNSSVWGETTEAEKAGGGRTKTNEPRSKHPSIQIQF